MLAGGMTIVAPSMMPAAHAANANLFVSAENSQFDNYMSGPQVIEVVVIDSDIVDTDQAKGEPDVTVNGKILRMVQAVDGNWYGYFADRVQASIADFTAENGVSGEGLDFGTFCNEKTHWAGNDISFTDTVGVAFPAAISTGSNGTALGTAPVGKDCSGPDPIISSATNNGTIMNVLREEKDVNLGPNGGTVPIGQIGLNGTSGGATTAKALKGIWPFIQLYTLNPTGNVVVQYNKGGGAQSTTLTFDTVDQFAGASFDRTIYPQDAQVHVTITDLWLNIDPTDEDSWTFGTNVTNGLSTNYEVFNENGGLEGAAVDNGIIDISGNLTNMMIENNGVLRMNPNTQNAAKAVLTIQDNDDSSIKCTSAEIASTCTVGNDGTHNVSTGGKSTLLKKNSQPVNITEQGPNVGVFGSYDESDKSVLRTTTGALRGTSATVDYNETPTTVLIGFNFATIDIQPIDEEWNSGEEIPVTLVDGDANKNSRADEDLDLFNPDVTLIPSLSTGDPFTIGEGNSDTGNKTRAIYANVGNVDSAAVVLTSSFNANMTVDTFSQIGRVNSTDVNGDKVANSIILDYQTTMGELRKSIGDTSVTSGLHGLNLLNLDVRSFNTTGTFDVYLLNSTANIIAAHGGISSAVGSSLIAQGVKSQSLTSINGTSSLDPTSKINATAIFDTAKAPDGNIVGLLIKHVDDTTNVVAAADPIDPIVTDFFSFGFVNDGLESGDRIANQIIRIEAEESGDNTSTFEGTLEYRMVNQLTILDPKTYTTLTPIQNDPLFIVIEDLTDEDSPRVNYLDLGADGVSTQIADQEPAPSHSGVVSFDANSYKTADTVTITVDDADLNVDSDLIDIYTSVKNIGDNNLGVIGSGASPSNGTSITLKSGEELGRLLDVTFNDLRWQTPSNACKSTLTGAAATDTGLEQTGFTLVETGKDSGVFMGDFQIPNQWCKPATLDGAAAATTAETVTGLDIEVNYVDFRDASGESIEVGDSAGIRANTGSVSLDRTVYPVPFGVPDNYSDNTKSTPTLRSLFPIHQTGMNGVGIAKPQTSGLDPGEFVSAGDLTIHVRVNDPDFDVSASGQDTIAQNSTAGVGPVKVSVIRGSQSVILGYAGGDKILPGKIDTDQITTGAQPLTAAVAYGPIVEIAPDAGIFESDIVLRYTDGPEDSKCPSKTTSWTPLDGTTDTAETDRFDKAATSGTSHCILQGDILQVEYTDPADASGDSNTVTDSATFDLRNGVLQSDKSVYIIGSDMILTLIEPDFDLDNDQAETYPLDLIEWDSSAATVTMGVASGEGDKFDPEPLNFRETGDSTGIFQIVIQIPDKLKTDLLKRGEEIVLEYTDWGPSGSDFVGDDNEDINLTLFTSNFGATVELDQKVYTWTDKVYITIVAPDHNFDSDLIDSIGETSLDPIKVATRGADLQQYKLVETGTDTGIFTGEVILTGFSHDADGDTTTGSTTSGFDVVSRPSTGNGPTDGLLPSTDDDGLTVSFEFSEDETVVGSALIRWNIGEVQWLEASYPASGTGVVRVIDPDMNLNPEAVDNFDADVWSDSDAGGIDLTVTETNEATGIFEGTVFFTTTDESSGHRLRVAEGDTVTARYQDNTLPNPYTPADELDITATSLIGTVVPPLERAPAANLRIVDAFGNSLDTVSVDQQVQVSADLANGQDREQTFAYLVQIQDANGVTVSLAWITGSLSSGQSFSPALSWIPPQSGSYTATAFVWESVDNPTALSPPVSTTVNVS